jgi:glucuronoarabinoxylan endo-1,4-beta-xylanase
MKTFFLKFSLLFFLLHLNASCGKAGSEPLPEPDPALPKVTVNIDKSVKYQTIEGFGFFGANDNWWKDAAILWNDAWAEKAISDLGITIWRNEIFPPADSGGKQDADWSKQRPVVEGLKAKADKYKVNLKFIATVWSPPADLKWECSFSWAGDDKATRNAGVVSTKNGGTLNPAKYAEYAEWLKSNIQLYKTSGVDLYALSLQNEPLFKQTFNSCTYTTKWYCDMLKEVAPLIKKNYPGLKIFGSEHMLAMEGKDINWKWFYHSAIKADPAVSSNLDILAVHGYSDGISASSGSELAKMWVNHTEQFAKPMNKQVWMTETSGYFETWEAVNAKPGALNLAMDMYAGLKYGNISAWVWWQGSQSGLIGEFNLMNNTTVTKRYYISKHYFRYIRPGAIRIESTSSDAAVFVTAYENAAKGTYTIVLINSGDAKSVSLEGFNLPASFKMYRTTSGSDNCSLISNVQTGSSNSFTVPAKSIVTLQAGGDAL